MMPCHAERSEAPVWAGKRAELAAHEDDLLPFGDFALRIIGAGFAFARLRRVQRVDSIHAIAALAVHRSVLQQLAEPAMNDEIGIAANGRREVAIVLEREREVADAF